jgi:hypothetical protein
MQSPQLPFLLAGGIALLLAFAPTTREAQDDPLVPAPAPTGPILLEGWRDLACAQCHAEQTEEWAGSAHALAWVDEIYQAELLNQRRPARCHGCHAPEPLHVNGLGSKPRVRPDNRHFGINCEACHLGPENTMLGPHGRPTDAHGTARGDSFKPGSSALCIGCHRVNIGPVIGLAKDFVAEGADGRPRSCVGCHMALVERDLPEDADEDALPRPGRSHRLRGPSDPAFLAKTFEVTLTREGEEVVLRLVNRAGHRLPGLLEQSFVFSARSLDGAGVELGTAEHAVDARNWLPSAGSASLRLPAGASVSLKAAYHPHGGGQPIPFLQISLPLAPAGDD